MSGIASSPDPFPITAAQLSGNFCETLFYGIYLVTCAFCTRTLFITGSGQEERWRRTHEVRWMMAIVASILFVICTFAVTMGLLRNFHAFVESKDARTELLNFKDWINIARPANQAVAMILGDSVLLYRCWIVYGRQWFVIIPSIILYLGNLAMAAKLGEAASNSGLVGGISLNSSQVRPWFVAFYATTAAQNTLTTSLLLWRIWSVETQRKMSKGRSNGTIVDQPLDLRRVMRVIAESGAAYTTCVFVTLVVSATKSNALYPTGDVTLQMTGITFNVILIRCSPRRDQQFTTPHRTDCTTVHHDNLTRHEVSSSPERLNCLQPIDQVPTHRFGRRQTWTQNHPTTMTV